MYYNFEEYAKNHKKKHPTQKPVNPFLEKPYSKEELDILARLAIERGNSISPEDFQEDEDDNDAIENRDNF